MLLFLVHMNILSSFLNIFLWNRPPWSTTQWYRNQSALVSTMISFLFFHHLSIELSDFRSPTRQISDPLWFTKPVLPPKIRLKGKIIKNLKLKTESYNNLLLLLLTLIYINLIKFRLCTTLHTIAYYIINKLPFTSISYIWRRLKVFEKGITAHTFK